MIRNIQVQTVANSNQVIFKTQTLDLEKREAFAKYMADEFGVEEKDITTEKHQFYRKLRDACGCNHCGCHCHSLYAALYLLAASLKISGLRQVQ